MACPAGEPYPLGAGVRSVGLTVHTGHQFRSGEDSTVTDKRVRPGCLPSNPTKIQEIAFLHEVAESVPGCSYMASLFTSELLVWVEAQIRQDVSPDVWHNMEHFREAHNKAVDAGRAKVKDLEQQLSKQDEILKGLTERHQVLKDRADEYREEGNQLGRDLAKAVTVGYEREGRIAALEDEVICLKAKLYDVLIGGGG